MCSIVVILCIFLLMTYLHFLLYNSFLTYIYVYVLIKFYTCLIAL